MTESPSKHGNYSYFLKLSPEFFSFQVKTTRKTTHQTFTNPAQRVISIEEVRPKDILKYCEESLGYIYDQHS